MHEEKKICLFGKKLVYLAWVALVDRCRVDRVLGFSVGFVW